MLKKTPKNRIITETNSNDKILYLGKRCPIKQIESYDWENYPEKLNLADFHIVIFDFSFITNPSKIVFDNISKLVTHNYWNLLFNTDSKIYILGDPGSIKDSNGPYTSFFSPITFIGYEILFEMNEGEIYTVNDVTYKDYFSSIKKYSFNFKAMGHPFDDGLLVNISQKIGFNIKELQFKYSPIAVNNFKQPIAANFYWQDKASKDVGADLIWLPANPSDPSNHENLFRTVLKLNIDEIAPEWIKQYELNSFKSLIEQKDNYTAQINKLVDEKRILEDKIKDRSRIFHLLYEQGQNLENAVKIALQELGCKVDQKPDLKNEDVCFVDPLGNNWICEIKGRKGGLKREDIRQLDDWVKGAMLDCQWSGYGAIISNYQFSLPLIDRKDYFPANEITALKRFGYTIIETKDLFFQIMNQENGNYNKTAFWSGIVKDLEKK